MSYRKHLPFELVALSFAKDLLGVTEHGHNRGPAVEMIQRAANIPAGSPWCAAFVNAAAEDAQMVKDMRSPLESVPLQGYVQSYYQYGVGHRWTPLQHPHPGALFCLWSETKQRYAHIGFVVFYFGHGQYTTVEGNSSMDGSFEGREVISRTRHMGSRDAFLDWTRDIEPRATTV